MSELINGTARSDVITGTSGDDTINAGAGNDVVTAGGGDDTVNGGDGNDRLDGGEGNDTLHGDDGNDRLYGGEGDDSLYGDSGNDWLWGGWGNDILHGDAGNDALFGDEGDDLLMGGAGDDHLDGGAGNDVLHGDEGDDLFFASEGTDYLYGGEGNDTVSYWKIAGKVVVYLGEMPDLKLTIKGAEGSEDAYSAQFGTDNLGEIENVIGSQFDDVIVGNYENNRLEGREGNDFLKAVGNDTLVGGGGSDHFGFSGNETNISLGESWIEDFNSAEGDKLDLSALGVDSLHSLHELVTIDDMPGESTITVNPDGLHLLGIYVIHVKHTAIDNPPLVSVDFLLA